MDAVKTVDKGVWVVEESVALNSLTIAEGASLVAPEGKSLTMTVYGVGKPIKPGSYKGDIFLTVTDRLMIQPGGLMRKGKPKEYRTAILVEDGKYIAGKSVPAIVKGGQVTDQATTGVTIQGSEYNFNGIIVKGDSEYTIEGVNIDLEGDRGNDFVGFGTGIMCIDNARVTVNNSDIHLLGLTRSALHAGGNSVVTLNNCRLSNYSPPDEGMNVVWMPGFKGTNRATVYCDYATVYYNNCHIRGNGWGICNVDGGIRTRIYLKDSTIELKGPRARGDGAFSLGDCFVSYDHCTVNVQGYSIIMGGSSAMAGTPPKCGAEITNGTIVNSTLYGVLIFRDKNSELEVNKGATLNTASSTFVSKGACAYLNIDNAILNPANGVVMQLMDNDEPGHGPSRYIPPIGEVDVAIPGRDLTTADPNEDVFMTLSNMQVKGNFFNSTTNLKANCREKAPAGETADWPGMTDLMDPVEMDESIGHDGAADTEAQQGAKTLDLKFVNVKVNGVISAATQAYKDGVTVIDVRNCEELSNVTQTAHEPVNNGVIVSLDKDCVWTVAGTSYLTSLTVAEGAVINATEGKSLNMTVDGVKTEIAPGKYSGKIIMTVT